MKIVGIKMKIFIIVFCVGFNINCFSTYKTSKENTNFENKVSICQISNSPELFYDKELLIEGEVTGFHRLFIYNSDCKTPESSMILDLSPEERSELFKKAEELKIDLNGSGKQKGNLYFTGKFKGILRSVDSVDGKSDCYNPNKDETLFNPSIKMCFEVKSIEELKSL